MEPAQIAIRHFLYGYAFRTQFIKTFDVIEGEIPYTIERGKEEHTFYVYKSLFAEVAKKILSTSRGALFI
jgi:hypothetical protein